MSHANVRVIRPAPSLVRSAVTAISLTLLLAVLGIVLFTMLRSPLKDDIAWLLYVARRWLAGRELYVDVVEVNPPLIVWISAIPIQLASALRHRCAVHRHPVLHRHRAGMRVVDRIAAARQWQAVRGSDAGVRGHRHRAAGGAGRRPGPARAPAGCRDACRTLRCSRVRWTASVPATARCADRRACWPGWAVH